MSPLRGQLKPAKSAVGKAQPALPGFASELRQRAKLFHSFRRDVIFAPTVIQALSIGLAAAACLFSPVRLRK